MHPPLALSQDWLALLQPLPSWHVLVLSSDNGELAQALAPRVARVTAVEVDQLALPTVGDEADEPGGAVVHEDAGRVRFAQAEDSFDAVICSGWAALRPATGITTLLETLRVLRPQGLFLLKDLIVPGSQLRGNKARRLREAGQYVNAWFALRDPGHVAYLSADAWQARLREARLAPGQIITLAQEHDFASWCSDATLSSADRLRLQAMLVQAPEKAKEFLTPTFAGARIRFRLTEALVLAARAIPEQEPMRL